MIETRQVHSRADVKIEVVHDSGRTSAVYLGVHTDEGSFEVNIDRQDFPFLMHMLNTTYTDTH
ncbi:hypothetical protein DWB77_02090 [Streptomyces hundungensis]|uniref:Uncharacterized protein n=1 Tax=Streptomyces hundungensis TaxID=1077946 RepID=A0A387HBB4_9ACTN|nr:hypothetical protein [Streptomyces hundungensis]AYG79971.1 hypothetical protein DWB77_02090 [Streptomyces hundungensis]